MDLTQKILQSKILIIDDQAMIGEALKEILEDEGFKQAQYISDSRQALDTYKTFQPDILVLDINMPFLNGFQIMESLKLLEKEKDSYLPVLVLTGETELEVRYKALQCGAKD